ncbi:hypothetical protein [Anaerobacillus sp. CMMVII]|nr:hypothetical protein [Anaerobacillus sp. CMMVII]
MLKKNKKIFLLYIILGVSWVFLTDFLVGLYIPLEWILVVQK